VNMKDAMTDVHDCAGTIDCRDHVILQSMQGELHECTGTSRQQCNAQAAS